MSVGSISPIELKRRVDAGEPTALLDVREDDERALCRIAAPSVAEDVHVPLGSVPTRFAEVAAIGAPLVVYCHHGVRSMVAARWLSARGVLGVLNLDGGIDAWSAEADPSVPRY